MTQVSVPFPWPKFMRQMGGWGGCDENDGAFLPFRPLFLRFLLEALPSLISFPSPPPGDMILLPDLPVFRFPAAAFSAVPVPADGGNGGGEIWKRPCLGTFHCGCASVVRNILLCCCARCSV